VSEDPVDIEDAGSLLRYLRQTGRIGADETPHVRVLAGGVSNKTVLVQRPTGESWVLKQALPKLRVKTDWFSDPSRIRREAEALRWLPKFAPRGTITPLIFEDPRHYVLAMQAVPQPHGNWKTMLLAGRVEDDHVDQFAGLLGAIHRGAAEAGEPVREAFDDRSFFESLRVEPYYKYTAGEVPEAADFLHELIADTRARLLTLVHGDFSPKNVLVRSDPDRIVLLDHEVIHWGDPAFDVGFALTHFVSKAHHLPASRQKLIAAALRFCETYAATLGPVYWDDNMAVMAGRHLLGCLLARVAGRSPLEYLTEPQRRRQRELAARAMGSPRRVPVTAVIEGLFGFGFAHADD
jgi:aminoglycoside phosphotransferase (APT) family kinase protein